MKNIPPLFNQGIAELGLNLSAACRAGLTRYLDLLLETNQHINLTAVRDPEEAWTRHLLDSLTLAPRLEELAGPAKLALIDVGSGGGLPALPLALRLPPDRFHFTLLEATGKKCRALEAFARELGLSHVRVLHARAEEAGQDSTQRESYDVCTCRAVSALPTLLELTLPFLKVGGTLLAMKGREASNETEAAAQALATLGGEAKGLQKLLPEILPDAQLVEVRKANPTPKAYPRAPGRPAKRPL